MARVNVYLPDDLASRARDADLPLSTIAQRAIEEELLRRSTGAWLERVSRLRPTAVRPEQALAALREARDEFGA